MMPGHPLLADEPGRTELLLGNEAIARGAIEAGVGFACGYPGTPSTEVTDAFALLAPDLGIPFEYSVNEKVALEMAFAASLAGARAIVAMKHLGLMSAGDPLSTIPYVGTVAGLVIVSAGDPSCHTSPNEQDQRQLAEALHLPMFDPRSPQEALEVTRHAFDVSERSRLPVVVRPTTRVCHTSAPVRFGAIEARPVAGFTRDPARFLPLPANARRMRVEITERLETARREIAAGGFFDAQGGGTTAVLASGAPAAICQDLLEDAVGRDEVALLSLGVVYPLPEDWLVASLRGFDTVLVVEELSPLLEDRVRALCTLHGLSLKVLGKRTGHLPFEFEYEPHMLRAVLHDLVGIGAPAEVVAEAPSLPNRPPTLCAACPHRPAFFAARSVFGDEALYFNDIGCYSLGVAPPLRAGDALLAMGAGFTLAAGVARTSGRQTLGFLGDSTFFHSGMPALLNAVKENVNMVAVIMDNEVTAMTGFQERPGAPVEDGQVQRTVDIEAVVRALGAPHVETVDPNDLAATVAAFERAKERDGLSVVISQRICPVFEARTVRRAPAAAPRVTTYTIDHERCRYCGRSSCGQRCGQGVVEDFERAMVRARSLELDGDRASRPDVAPCATRCPLFLCIQGYAAHIAAGRYADALELILDGLPLAESVCRVCHKPCEDVCVRGGLDEPVAINDLKRFVMDWAASQDEYPHTPEPEPAHGRSAAVVGAGPAGLAAAHDLAMRGYDVHLYDANAEPGGLLLTGVPEYRLPREVLRRDTERILGLGVSFEGGRHLGADLRLGELVDGHDGVVIALGAADPLTLPIEGEGPAVVQALAYLQEPDTAAGTVLVVGGGNAAIDAARTALRRGAEHVIISCLEARDEMPAISGEIEAAEDEGVDLLCRTRATRLVAGGAELVEVHHHDPARTDPASYEARAGTDRLVAAELVVLAVGQAPQRVAADGTVELDWTDGLVVDPGTGRTSHAGVYAAGDVLGAGGSVTGAIAGGLRAAWGLDRSLRGPAAADVRMPPPVVPTRPPPGRPGVRRDRTEGRRRPVELDPGTRMGGFEEVVATLTEDEARAEAARCMICGLCGNCSACLDLFGCPAFYVDRGAVEIDAGLCVACGVCAQFCPNGAIVPVIEPAVVR